MGVVQSRVTRAAGLTPPGMTVYWLWVSDFVDPVNCEQSVGDARSLQRCNDTVALTTKNQHFIILGACVIIATPQALAFRVL
jgi:hypothetical protein